MALIIKKPAAKASAPAAKAAPVLAKPGLKKTVAAPKITASDPLGIGGPKRQVQTPQGFQTGARINAENARKAEQRRNLPYEFGMTVGEGGTDGVTIVITDKAVAAPPGKPLDPVKNSPFFCWMHRWGFEEKNPQQELCIRDGTEGCPLCDRLGKEGSYEMMLTCIDSRPYTPKNGPNKGKTVPIQRRLYVVKTSMQAEFQRIWEEYGGYRGLVLKCFRDSAKSPRGGSSVRVIKRLSEKELAGIAAKYKDPKLIEPVDYLKAFPRPTHAEMVSRYGGTTTILGAADSADDVGSDDIPF